jgi:hypothetical protein
MAVLVMLNNYTHDLATAVFAVSALAAWLVLRSDAVKQAPRALRPLVQGLVKIGTISFVVTLLLGAVRSAAYRQYEWSEAVGRAQVPALMAKHVILVVLVVLGLWVLYRVRKESRDSLGEEAGA